MVAYITADDPNMQVLGTPGKNLSEHLTDKLKDCEPVYVCLDPDAREDARRLASTISKERCRIVELPDKIDDLILKYRLNKVWMRGVLRQAVKL